MLNLLPNLTQEDVENIVTTEINKLAAVAKSGNYSDLINPLTALSDFIDDSELGGSFEVNAATNAQYADQLSQSVNVTFSGALEGSFSFDGSASSVAAAVSLVDNGVTAGTYSAVAVNSKGLVTGGAQLIEVGGVGQATPSENLASGGIFFKQI